MAPTGPIRAGRAFIELATKDSELNKGLNRARRRLRAFAASAAQIGRGMAVTAAAMAAPLLAGTQVFATYQDQLAEVSTMLQEPATHLEAFDDRLREMAVEFGESTTTLSRGLYDILSASIAPAKALDVLAVSAKAAKAGITETGVAADAITTILNSYGMAAEEAASVSDLLFSVVQRGKTTFAELAPNIGKVASLAASAGVSLEELGAMIATLTRNGVQTDNAITALNAVISGFLRPGAEAQQVARELGIELNTATLQSEGLLGVFQKLGQLDPETVAKLFPNIRALRGLFPALQNLEGFSEDLAAMGDRAGATEVAFQRMSQSAQHDFNQVREAGIEVLRSLGEALAPAAVEIARSLKEWATSLSELIADHQDLVVWVAKLAGGLAIVGGGFLIASQAASAVAMSITAAQHAAAGAATAFKLLSAASAFLLANPLVAAIAAATAVVGGLALALAYGAAQAREWSTAMRESRQRGDEMRATHQEMVARLDQLSQKQSLTSEEQQEATRIIRDLEAAYGDLGLELDETSGKLDGVAGAQQKVNEQMRAVAITQLQNELSELGREAEQVHKQLAWATGGGLDRIYGPQDRAAESKLNAQSRRIAAREMEIRNRLAALRDGDPDALTGQPKADGPTAPDPAAAAAAAQREAAEEAIAQRRRRLAEEGHRLELQQIENRYDRERALLQYNYNLRIRKAKDDPAAQAALRDMRDLEIRALDRRQGEERAEAERREAQRRDAAAESLDEELARAEIRGSKTGRARRLAELELEEEAYRQRAREMGLDQEKVDHLFALRRGEILEQSTRQTTVAGTFSATAAGMMAGGSPAERTAKHTEQIAANTDKTNDKLTRLERRRLEFA